MKRLIAIVALVLVTIGSASAQKKDVALLSEELNAVKAREAVLQHKVDSLAIALESNKQLMAQMTTLLEAYTSLENAYTTNTEDINKLTTKIDQLIEALASAPTQTAAPAPAEPAKPKYETVGKISSGMVLVKEGFFYGYANSSGEYVIEAKYEEAKDFKDGYALVRRNDKWGVVDTSGKETIACAFDQIEIFNGAVMRVRKGNLFGLMSAATGATIQPTSYTEIYDLSQNRAMMRINGKYGYFDEKGKTVIAAQYNDANDFNSDGKAWVFKGGGEYYIYTNGSYVGE
ncbi:MAG: WG repeat-containing protein [Alistipes sp.]|nr:WG repeat-containing protein [Alistipes sp.]